MRCEVVSRFLSVRKTNRIYPDTGERGEAYDAEASLDR